MKNGIRLGAVLFAFVLTGAAFAAGLIEGPGCVLSPKTSRVAIFSAQLCGQARTSGELCATGYG